MPRHPDDAADPKAGYELRGIVRDARTKEGLPRHAVVALDVDRDGDDFLGRTFTHGNGEFRIRFRRDAFVKSRAEDKREGGPDLLVRVLDKFGHVVHEQGPLVDADRRTALCLDVEVREEHQRPVGPPLHDPFEVLAAEYEAELKKLTKAGVKSRADLFERDPRELAKQTRLPLRDVEAMRLHTELAHAAGFDRGVATALAAGGIASRERLATIEPRVVAGVIEQARRDGVIPAESKITNSTMYGWIGYARGMDPGPFSKPFNLRKVLHDSKLVVDQVASQNPSAVITAVAGTLNPFSRFHRLAGIRALLDAAGVGDLSALGTFRVQGQRRIGPGYHVALPNQAFATALGNKSLAQTIKEFAGGFGKVKVVDFPGDGLYIRPNPVTDAVILGSVVDFIESGKLIIGADVTALWIVTEEILYSQLNEITWEDRFNQPEPRSPISPAQAVTGPTNDRNIYTPNGGNRGRNGGRGGSGADGQPGINGDVRGPAPEVTLIVKWTPEGMPDVLLTGRRGGTGQPGQNGGHGGDGARGREACSGLCQCERGVGHGGDAGDGGRGGDGGMGGAGGSGGKLTIMTLDDNIAPLMTGRPVVISVEGGPGGNGGSAGIGGPGGRGGAPGDDSSPWCDPHLERVGKDGVQGPSGAPGANGPEGPGGTFTLQPITEDEWDAAFNQPWLVRLEPWTGPVGTTVHAVAKNITNDVRVVVDGVFFQPTSVSQQGNVESVDFVIPPSGNGGLRSVQLRIEGTNGPLYSNMVSFRITPTLDSVTPGDGVPGTQVRLNGSGFAPGADVKFGSKTFPASFVDARTLVIELPDHENIGMGAGSIPVSVVNPDGRVSNSVTFELALKIKVRVKAWRVFPDIWVGGGGGFGGPGPARDEDDIRDMFSGSDSPRSIWLPHNIELVLDPNIGRAEVSADIAECWPRDQSRQENTAVIKAKDTNGAFLHFEPGAVNFYFVSDIDDWTTHAFTYRGSETSRSEYLIYEDTGLLTAFEEKWVAAHELGHVFGLPHVCGDENDVTFGRECDESSDCEFLMYPTTSSSHEEGTTVSAGEARKARGVTTPWHNL